MKDRKKDPEDKSFDPDNDKINFNKPKSNAISGKTGTKTENISSSSKIKVGGGLLMDEYVVGMSKPRVSKSRAKGNFLF